jgi:D-serine deaminase-like pyridoxal phosphate-dependent protein
MNITPIAQERSIRLRETIDMRDYSIVDSDCIYSPGLIIFEELLDSNLRRTIEWVGGADRLRPHCKTHKCRQIIQRQLELGISRHKCATVAEAEMLADCGVTDILIAYQLVGPNLQRFQKLLRAYPQARFLTLVDHCEVVERISETASAIDRSVGLMLDLNSGMGRTGLEPDQSALELYELIAACPGTEPAGLHWYDGHHRHPELEERRRAVLLGWERLTGFRDRLLINGLPVPRVVTGGTGSFAILAETEEPGLELSPGTTTLFDADLAELFPELELKIAAAVLTRVVSLTPTSLTLDVGHKSCGADQPAGHRLFFPGLPDAVETIHSEEHLVIKTSQANQFKPGDSLLAFPRHICPTVAVHQFATLVSGGQVVGEWKIDARDRRLNF